VTERDRRGAGAPRRGILNTRAPLIGLIGPIGCGKSTVAGWLAACGAAVVDADELTREVMAPGTPVSQAVIAHFGGEYRRADGSLDRVALGRLVFADPVRLAELESIVHPAVAGMLEASIRVADTRAPGAPAAPGAPSAPVAIVLEAIKLVEAGHGPWCDEIWLIVCDPKAQLARLIGRGIAEPDARQRIAAQAASLKLWRAAATRTIRTDGPPDAVEHAVDAELAETLARRR
jgi:dephospho-CoA kinase